MDVIARLKCLGVKGILMQAAKEGRIDALECRMERCHCPTELGGRSYFEPVNSELSDWMPTVDHFPKLKSQGGYKTLENSRLAHRLCNRIDYSISIGRPIKRDLARVKAAREGARDGTWHLTVGWSSEVAELLCGPDVSVVRSFVTDLRRWPGVGVDAYFDRGSGPTGVRLFRGRKRFANVFPTKSLQFAHGGQPLMGLGLPSEENAGRHYQMIRAAELPGRLDEAWLLAAYAYWRVG